MEALGLLCPGLKSLRIYSIGEKNILDYLSHFGNLTKLTIANTQASISFRFGGSLLRLLRTQLGRQLKSLHLIALVDVNLRSIAKCCTSLAKLSVEFIGYYERFFTAVQF